MNELYKTHVDEKVEMDVEKGEVLDRIRELVQLAEENKVGNFLFVGIPDLSEIIKSGMTQEDLPDEIKGMTVSCIDGPLELKIITDEARRACLQVAVDNLGSIFKELAEEKGDKDDSPFQAPKESKEGGE